MLYERLEVVPEMLLPEWVTRLDTSVQCFRPNSWADMPNGKLGFVVYNRVHAMLVEQSVVCNKEISTLTKCISVWRVGHSVDLDEAIGLVSWQHFLRRLRLRLKRTHAGLHHWAFRTMRRRRWNWALEATRSTLDRHNTLVRLAKQLQSWWTH